MLRVTMLGEQPHAPSAGAESWPVLVEANSSIHKHFWLTVNFPAIAPGIPTTPYSFLKYTFIIY
jgi:hypothetical protein